MYENDENAYQQVLLEINYVALDILAVMGREISRPEFPAGTRRETLSRPVLSRNFEDC